MVKIIIPSLPNQASMNTRAHWGHKSALAEKARLQAIEAARKIGVKGLMMTPVEIRFSFFLPTNRPRDLDNLGTACKSWLDGLTAPHKGPKGKMSTGASVIPDDSIRHVYSISYEWFPCEGVGWTGIEIVQRTDTK